MDNNYNGNQQNNGQQQNGYQYSNGGQQQNGYQYQAGNQQQGGYQQPMGGSQKTPGNGPAIASMVCGICSIVFCWCYGVVGLVLGIVALAMWNKSKLMNGGNVLPMAKAGMICGIVGSVLSALYLVYFIIVCATAASYSSWMWYL